MIITLPVQICNAVEYNICSCDLNNTNGSTIESNLNRVLNSLVQRTSPTGFNMAKYMACSNAGETQQSNSVTIVHHKQRLAFNKIVGTPSVLKFGLISATYVIKIIVSSDNWILWMSIIFTMYGMPSTLLSLTKLLRVYSAICQLKQYLDLNYTLPEQLQTPCLERFRYIQWRLHNMSVKCNHSYFGNLSWNGRS